METQKNNLSAFDLALQRRSHEQTTSLLKSSIAKEENGKKMAQKIVSLEEQVKTMRKLVEPLLQEMEARIDNCDLTVEIAEDYLKLAEYMRDTFGRNSERRIEYAQAWLNSPDSLPFK